MSHHDGNRPDLLPLSLTYIHVLHSGALFHLPFTCRVESSITAEPAANSLE
jgi:hypothetical protein